MIENAAFDHLLHWTTGLDEAMAAYDAAHLPTQAGLTMPGFRNAVWGVDDVRYVELFTVDDWDAVTTSIYADGVEFLRPAIEALPGPGLVTFAVDVPDARATADRLRAAGHDVLVVDVRLEDRDAGFVEVFVRDAPPCTPFFITYDPPREEMGRHRAAYREEHGIPRGDERHDLVALLARADDPDREARRLAELLGCERTGNVVALPGAEIRVEEGAPGGLFGVAVSGLAPSTPDTDLLGMTVRPA